MRSRACALCVALVLAACASRPPPPPPPPPPPTVVVAPPTVTRGEFTLPEAIPLDVWNAIGDVIVRTPQASYDSRSQMLGLYSVHYRGETILLVAHPLPLSDSIHVLTTQVTAKSVVGAPVDSAVVAELLAVLQRELPAEIIAVRARQAAEAAAAAQKAKSHKAKSRKAKTPKKK